MSGNCTRCWRQSSQHGFYVGVPADLLLYLHSAIVHLRNVFVLNCTSPASFQNNSTNVTALVRMSSTHCTHCRRYHFTARGLWWSPGRAYFVGAQCNRTCRKRSSDHYNCSLQLFFCHCFSVVRVPTTCTIQQEGNRTLSDMLLYVTMSIVCSLLYRI